MSQFYSRWRITTSQRTALESSGLLPHSSTQLIEGFWPRDERGLAAFWNANNDNNKELVLSGVRPLTLSLANECCFRDEDPDVDVFETTGHLTLDIKLESIMTGRKMASRLKPSHTRLPTVGKLIERRDKFFSLLSDNKTPDGMPDLSHLEPVKVKLHLAPTRRRDRMPCMMGASKEQDVPDEKRIMSRRLLGIKYRQFCTEEEIRIADEENAEEFKSLIFKLKQAKRALGMQFMSPAGLPTVGFLDGKRFNRPQSVNFEPLVGPNEFCSDVFMFRGTEVEHFKPSLWSDATLEGHNNALSFGYGLMDGEMHVFYKAKRQKIRAMRVNQAHGTFQLGRLVVSYLCGESTGPCSYGDLSKAPTQIANVSGPKISMINYCNWYKTNNTEAFRYWASIFEERGCECPWFVRKHMKKFPYFNDEQQTFQQATEYSIFGPYTTDLDLRDGGALNAVVDCTNAVAICRPAYRGHVQKSKLKLEFV
jgi:hypothetical protein